MVHFCIRKDLYRVVCDVLHARRFGQTPVATRHGRTRGRRPYLDYKNRTAYVGIVVAHRHPDAALAFDHDRVLTSEQVGIDKGRQRSTFNLVPALRPFVVVSPRLLWVVHVRRLHFTPHSMIDIFRVGSFGPILVYIMIGCQGRHLFILVGRLRGGKLGFQQSSRTDAKCAIDRYLRLGRNMSD